MDTANGGKFTTDANQAVNYSSLSLSTGVEPQITERPDEPPKNEQHGIKFPQEILDMVWRAALEPWLKKRVIVLDCLNQTRDDVTFREAHAGRNRPQFLIGCANPTDFESSKLVGNIRLVNRKARDTVSRYSSKFREMFPKSPNISHRRLDESFRAQHADFQRDIFWLSKDFLCARFQYISYDRGGSSYQADLSRDLLQPSHMMLSLRHMLAFMQMIFIRNTPCIGTRHLEIIGLDNPLRDFHLGVQINRQEQLRALTVLLPQNIDEWSGKVDYEDLEHRPFGTSVEDKASVLELARTQEARGQLEKIYAYWSNLVSLAEADGVDLPTLQFSRRRL